MDRIVLLGALVLVGWGSPLGAQGFERSWEQAQEAIEAKRWAEAHAIVERTVKQFDSRATVLFGPKFGWFWYQKGRCEMELERWDEAKKSFEICRKKYPNPIGGRGVGASVNPHVLDALRGLGDVAFQTGEVEEAALLYRMWFQEYDAAKAREAERAEEAKAKEP